MKRKLVYKKDYRKAITDNANNVKSKYDLKNLYTLSLILTKTTSIDSLKEEFNTEREIRLLLDYLVKCSDADAKFLRYIRLMLRSHIERGAER